jgi:AcrR family transcriptional regulator
LARTPSKEAHERVLNAAFDLIAERGIEATSMDAIAAASGVSKATVYKHWASKDALLIDVIRQQPANYPTFDSGDPRADLVALLRHLAHRARPERMARIWPRVIGYAATNPKFARALQEYVFQPRRAAVLRVLAEAAEKSGLRKDVDPELAMDLLIGPIMHRRFADEKGMPKDLPERVVDYFWQVYGRPRK